MTGASKLLRNHWRLRRILIASARVELRKRYAGSLLGPAWAIVYPVLYLSVYVFLWSVVLRVRAPGSPAGYVVMVFGGLVPFLFLMDSVTSASTSIRQNIHLVKSVIVPIELIPTRAVLVASVGHAAALVLLAICAAAGGDLSSRIALLPLVLLLQLMWLAGLSWIAGPLGVIVPDVTFVLNVAATMLMFVSPIAFRPDMVPERWRFIVWLNPVTYMVESYRAVFVADADIVRPLAVFALLACTAFWSGAAFCARVKGIVVDFE